MEYRGDFRLRLWLVIKEIEDLARDFRIMSKQKEDERFLQDLETERFAVFSFRKAKARLHGSLLIRTFA